MVTTISDPVLSGLNVEWMGATHVASVLLPIEPVPASRPRVTRWGTYHAKPYKNWLDSAAEFLPGLDEPLDPDETLLVIIESICTRARTSKLLRPKGDVDNYAKGPMDAITHAGGYWQDDVQVVALVSTKRFAAKDEPACTKVHILKLP
jgi:Holliday junction resolvase RusA-like endonuclease